MVGLALLTQDVFGTGTKVFGAPCGATSPASMAVLMGAGRIYTLASVDATAISSLAADTTQIVKQGVTFAGATLLTPAPTTTGQSINYLIQCQYQDNDIDNAVLSYWNASDPEQPFSGANNDGNAQPTTRAGQLVYGIKAGAAATTGSQTTPTADTGWTGIYVVSVPFGATTVTSSNIATFSGAPLFTTGGVQTGTTTMTFAGYTGTVTTTCPYTIVGDVVTLRIPAVTGTSNLANFSATISNLALQPTTSAAQYFVCPFMEDNGGLVVSQVGQLSKGSGSQTSFIFYKGTSAAGWTASGTKALGDGVTGFTVTYKLV